MSDFSQGPDWWLASDGKWYPPQSRPMMPPPYVKPPGLGPKLSGWMQGLLWAGAAVAGINAVLQLSVFGASSNYEKDPGLDTLMKWADIEDTSNGWLGFLWIATIAIFVLIIIWSFQAHKAADSLAPGRRTWSRGWSVGGWFIPLANAVIPFLVIGESQRIGSAGRMGGVVDPNWKRTSRMSPLGVIWWTLFVGSYVFGAIASAVMPAADGSLDEISTYQTAYLLGTAGSLLRAASGVLGALYVRSIARELSPSGLAVRDTVAQFTAAPLPPPPSTPPPPAWPN